MRLAPVRSAAIRLRASAAARGHVTDVSTDAFLASVAGHPLFATYHLIAMRGLRRGEACGLQWDDLDLDEGVAYTSRQLQHGAGNGDRPL